MRDSERGEELGYWLFSAAGEERPVILSEAKNLCILLALGKQRSFASRGMAAIRANAFHAKRQDAPGTMGIGRFMQGGRREKLGKVLLR